MRMRLSTLLLWPLRPSKAVARNIGIDSAWKRGQYQPVTKQQRALVLADRIERHASAARWVGTGGIQKNFELVG